MKFNDKTGMYKASNVTFDLNTLNAFSYSWWRFVAVIDGMVVFNNHNYSNTTRKHQAKVRSVMSNLGIKIDLELPVANGIKEQDLETLILEAEEFLCNQYMENQIKKQDAYARAKARKAAKFDEQLDACILDIKTGKAI